MKFDLSLAWNPIENNAIEKLMKTIIGFEYLKHLKLNFSFCQINDIGAKIIADYIS